MNVTEWQRLMRTQPTVFLTVDRDGEVVNAYESAAAAAHEVEFHKALGNQMFVRKLHVHSIYLSRERWRLPKEIARHASPGSAA